MNIMLVIPCHWAGLTTGCHMYHPLGFPINSPGYSHQGLFPNHIPYSSPEGLFLLE